MSRIAVGGFQHETNTFAPSRATFAEFEKHDGWPGLVRGPDLFAAVADMNLPVTGFIDAARGAGHELVPLVWCSAEPSGPVTEDAFERVSRMILEGLAEHEVDALYLDLHGAMVSEHLEDGEGEILRRVRARLGTRTPVVASLDLHANLSRAMVERASALTVYRTYPHLDMAASGERAYALLARLLAGERLAKAFRQGPFLIPLGAQCTDFEPNRSLYARLSGCAGRAVASVDYACGFPAADIADCGPAIVAYGADREAVERAADDMLSALLAAEGAFVNELLAPEEAVRAAMRDRSGRTVVLADAQDNPGAGGTSDTTGLLRALVAGGARDAILAILHDPEVAARAHELGADARFEAQLGGRSRLPGDAPMAGHFHVRALGDGRFTCTGEMYRGTRTALGPMARLGIDESGGEVEAIVGSTRFQCLDQAIFRHLGVEPAKRRIVAVKSTVHFRADFASIAGRVLVAEAPGANPCRLASVPYRRLRPGVRVEPRGPVWEGPAVKARRAPAANAPRGGGNA